MGGSITGLTVIAAAALLGLALFWGVSGSRAARTGAPATPIPATATAIPATATPVSPLPTPTPPGEISIDDYQFGEPQPLLQHSGTVLLGDWLPRSEKISVVTYVVNSDVGMHEISTVAPTTGEVQVFGRRMFMFIARKPSWLSDVEKMAFVGANVVATDEHAPPQHLWITSAGTITLTNPIVGDVATVVGSGHTVLAIRRGENTVLSIDAATGTQTTLPVDLDSYGIDTNSPYLQMVWHPHLPLVAVFDPNNFLILNPLTGETNAIELGESVSEADSGDLWAFNVAWDATGNRLVVIGVTGEPVFNWTHLLIADGTTGVVRECPKTLSRISDIALAPNGKQLIYRGMQETTREQEYYLLDIESCAERQLHLFPPSLYDGLSGWNLSWSLDGSKLVVRQGDSLYNIDVTVQPSGSRDENATDRAVFSFACTVSSHYFLRPRLRKNSHACPKLHATYSRSGNDV